MADDSWKIDSSLEVYTEGCTDMTKKEKTLQEMIISEDSMMKNLIHLVMNVKVMSDGKKHHKHLLQE